MTLILFHFTEIGGLQGALRTSACVRCRFKKLTFAISSPDEILVFLIAIL